MKILISGSAGNIGSALAERLIRNKSYHVVGIDNFVTGHSDKLPLAIYSNFEFIEGDANDFATLSNIMTTTKFDVVFHYAAIVGVKRTLENPLLVLNDIQGIKNILDLSKSTRVKRIFYSSSSEVYGEPVEFPQNEHTTPLNSRLPYAIVKNVGEAFLRSYYKEYALPYTIFRFFNTYGPRQSEDFVMSKFIKQALNNQDITIYGDGSQSRTFCYIEDNIDATLLCLEQGHCINDIMNIGNDREYSIRELANVIIKVTGSDSKIIHLPPLAEGDMSRRKPDISKMNSILNRELIPLEEGIKRVVHHILSK